MYGLIVLRTNLFKHIIISMVKMIEEAKKHSIIFNGREGEKTENYTDINIDNLKKIFAPKSSEYYTKEYKRNHSRIHIKFRFVFLKRF